MEPTQDHFPIFDANQVLTSEHLNTVFTYLDEQVRLTRAHLIGIGIVCGFDLKLAGTTANPVIQISKGCGITSQGFLVGVPKDLELTHFREGYVIENQYDAESLLDPKSLFAAPDSGDQYPLWELFESGEEPNASPLAGNATFLADKAVVLFLELKQQLLRNCSPNNCDDKGSEVAATVKPLLIERPNLAKMIAVANELTPDMTVDDLAAVLLEKLRLPNIRIPRFDVPNSAPVSSADIYVAFLDVFRSGKLVAETTKALHAAYQAFRPLLKGLYPSDPFGGFANKFGFLDSAPKNIVQVQFIQYFYDFFDDLLRAYDEFRWRGAALACSCCPPEWIFPRHLMLGLLHPESVTTPSIFRHGFIASFADCCCGGGKLEEVLQLFQRLVEMTLRFTDTPPLPPATKHKYDQQVRITPSVLGNEPLAEKAIPYYYRFNATPRLYELWSPEKSRRRLPQLNLAYRSDEYSPAAPDFVTNPLSYDLEPYGFLRVEGHLGKSYQRILSTLLWLRNRFRLPVDFVALRSGDYDDTQALDLDAYAPRFQDLEAIYDSRREGLLRALTEGLMFYYSIPAAGTNIPASVPNHPLLKKYAPNFRHPSNSVGAWCEDNLARFGTIPYIDVNQNNINSNEIFTVYCTLFFNATPLPAENHPPVVAVYYFTKLAEVLPLSLDELAFPDFKNKYEDLLGLLRYLRTDATSSLSSDLLAYIPQEDLIDHFDHVLYSCELGPIEAVHDEYLRRLREIKRQLFLSYFLEQHPGIQHKAGVPLGGTFILVYHQAQVSVSGASAPAKSKSLTNSIDSVMKKRGVSSNAAVISDIVSIVEEQLGSIAGVGASASVSGKAVSKEDKMVLLAIEDLADGAVIADFYLPYRVSSENIGVQFVLPKVPPSFTVAFACPDADGVVEATVTVKGGVAPYDIDVDGLGYELLSGPISLTIGKHTLTVRDLEGAISTPRSVEVVPITIGTPSYQCSADFKTYTATVVITGGTPPYTVNGSALPGSGSGVTFTTNSINSGKTQTIEVLDANKCVAKSDVVHTCVQPCTLPCEGVALNRNYRFWWPQPGTNSQYTQLKIESASLIIESAPGKQVDLSAEFLPILGKMKVTDLNKDFNKAITGMLAQINKLVADKIKNSDWFKLAYEAPKFGSIGTLSIENFQCLNFTIKVISQIMLGEITSVWNFTYSPEGTLIQPLGRAAAVNIPSFAGNRIDKCAPDPVAIPLCRKPPDIKVTVEQQVFSTKLMATLTAKLTGINSAGAVLLWEAQDATPALANGESVTLTFSSAGEKFVQLTVFATNGCTITEVVNVKI